MTTTSYARVNLRPNSRVAGKTLSTVDCKNGVTLTRVTADGRDDLVIAYPNRAPWEVPWSNVVAAEPKSLLPTAERRGIGLMVALPVAAEEALTGVDAATGETISIENAKVTPGRTPGRRKPFRKDIP